MRAWFSKNILKLPSVECFYANDYSDKSEKLCVRRSDSNGYDLYNYGDPLTIYPGEIAVIPTGVKFLFHHCFGLILSRSGLASNGIVVANAPGLVDVGYDKHVKVMLQNNGSETWEIRRKQSVGQILFLPDTSCIPVIGSPTQVVEKEVRTEKMYK